MWGEWLFTIKVVWHVTEGCGDRFIGIVKVLEEEKVVIG